MDKAAQRRWVVLLLALAATVAAMVYPTESQADGDAAEVVQPEARRTAPTSKPNLAVVAAAQADELPKLEDDPFAPRGWTAPPPPPPPAPVVITPPPPPAPAGPPPLPYRFMGRLNDDGNEVIYLSHGEQTLVAKTGETLESTYKVLGIAAQRIEFEYLPTGDKQSLTIAAPDN